jgi:hypothetical protein
VAVLNSGSISFCAAEEGGHMNGLVLWGYRIPAKQVVGGIVLWLLIATVLWSTRKMPFYDEGAPGPRFMPVVLSVTLAILNVFYWAESVTREPPKIIPAEERNLLRPAVFLAFTILLIVLWEPIGALVAVLLCALLELRYLERYAWGKSILVSALISGVTLSLFQIILGVPLPGGIFETLSYVRL